MAEDAPIILALARDLIFSTKIATTAKAIDVAVRIVRDPAKLAGVPGGLLLADLNMPGAIAAAAEWRATSGGAVVGFVSHVDAETAASARRAGIDQVMARSRFVELLPVLLTKGIVENREQS